MKQRKTKKMMVAWALAMLGFVPMAHAQELIHKIEAESATLTVPSKVYDETQYTDRGRDWSGQKYVGDNDPGSGLEFKVMMDEAGSYELHTYYRCGDGSRGISIKVNDYKEVTTTVPGTTDWYNPPSGVMKAAVYMDKGENTVVIKPYQTNVEDPAQMAGPNLDYFEIRTTKEAVLPEVDAFPKVYEAEDAELYGELKVKPTDGSTKNGLSGGRYIGDFNQRANSYFVLPNVEVPESGTYEMKVFSMGSSRALSIKVNQYERTIIRTQDTPSWDDAPALETSLLVYLDKGKNKIVFNSYNDDGPNVDKIEIHETDQTIDRPNVKLLAYAADFTDGAKITTAEATADLANATDNDEYSVYKVAGKASAQIVAECEYPILLTGYLLSAGIGSDVDLTKWTVEGSMDGEKWTKITPEKQNDLSGAMIFEVKRSRDKAMTDRAKFYRLTATGETDVEIAEWQLFGSPHLDNTDGKSFPADLTEGLDIAAAAKAWPEGYPGEGYINLFDRNLFNKYYMADTKAFQVEIDLGKVCTLDAYTLTSVDVDPDRNPKKWVLNGWNEELGWVEIDTQAEYAFPCGYATMRFDIDSEMAFSKFLLDVIDNNGSNSSQLLKWQLFGTEYTGSGIAPVADMNCSVWSEDGRLCIHSEGADALTYRVFDLSGASLKQGALTSTQEELALSQGMYVVMLSDGEKKRNVKVIVK